MDIINTQSLLLSLLVVGLFFRTSQIFPYGSIVPSLENSRTKKTTKVKKERRERERQNTFLELLRFILRVFLSEIKMRDQIYLFSGRN